MRWGRFAVIVAAVAASGACTIGTETPQREPSPSPRAEAPSSTTVRPLSAEQAARLQRLMVGSYGRRCRRMVNRVAFSWTEPATRIGRDTFDVYLKLVGTSDVRRLTTEPGRNWAGGWSPDGQRIAYFRDVPRG